MCFGMAFGAPFVVLGLILIFDRERSWQRRIQRGTSDTPPRRTRSWDRRQIAYGMALIAFGIAIIIGLSVFNLWAQGFSPPAPF